MVALTLQQPQRLIDRHHAHLIGPPLQTNSSPQQKGLKCVSSPKWPKLKWKGDDPSKQTRYYVSSDLEHRMKGLLSPALAKLRPTFDNLDGWMGLGKQVVVLDRFDIDSPGRHAPEGFRSSGPALCPNQSLLADHAPYHTPIAKLWISGLQESASSAQQGVQGLNRTILDVWPTSTPLPGDDHFPRFPPPLVVSCSASAAVAVY